MDQEQQEKLILEKLTLLEEKMDELVQSLNELSQQLDTHTHPMSENRWGSPCTLESETYFKKFE